jgi:hypothetical protein
MKSLINIFLLLLITFSITIGCKKPTTKSFEEKDKGTLKIFLKGVVVALDVKYASTNNIDGLKVENNYTVHDGFESALSFYKSGHTQSKNSFSSEIPIPGTSKLDDGIRYRFMLYHVDEQNHLTFYGQTDLVVEEEDAALINVEIGEKYKWYAYSYNSTEGIAPIADVDNPVVFMGYNKDFIYTNGEFTLNQELLIIDVIFQRSSAQLTVEFDARGLFTDEIRDLTLRFPSNVLKTGNFNILHDEVVGSFVSLPEQIVPLSGFENVDEGFNDRKRTSFFTAVPEVWNSIYFSLNKFDIILDDNNSIRSFPSTDFTLVRNLSIEVGKRYIAKIDLIESPLIFGGVSWARENLYRNEGGRNPYRFYHENKQTNDFRSYFSFKGHIPGKWGSTIIDNQRDPCALVHPSNRWMTPSKSSFNELTKNSSGVVINSLLPTVLGNLLFGLVGQQTLNSTYGPNYIQYNTASGINSIYPSSSNVLRFYYNGYDLISLNVLGDGWVNLNLGNTYGLATGLWTDEQGVNLLSLLGAGAWVISELRGLYYCLHLLQQE